jgi:hypothetical protein
MLFHKYCITYWSTDLESVKQTLARTPDHVNTHPESGMTRALYDCTSVPLTPTGPEVRLIIASNAERSPDPKTGERNRGENRTNG